jgi:hypothetical protein
MGKRCAQSFFRSEFLHESERVSIDTLSTETRFRRLTVCD